MSSPVPAIAFPTSPPPPATLAEVARLLPLLATTGPERVKVLDAAVRTAARVLGAAPDTLPAAPREILPMLARLTPVDTGLSSKTLANTRSLVKEAIVLVGAGKRVRSARVPLSPSWQPLYEALPDKRFRNGLSRFMHFASRENIEPSSVDEQVLDRFVAELRASGQVANVDRRYRDTAVLWNRCVEHIPRWPHRRLAEPVVARRLKNLLWKDMPDEFQSAVDAYCAWLSGSDVFAENGPPKPYKPTTIRQRREIIRVAASALLSSGFPSLELRSLQQLVAPANAKTVLKGLHERAAGRKTAFLTSVATELVFIAGKYLRVDTPVLGELRGMRRKVSTPMSGLTSKNQALLQHLANEDVLLKLVALPDRLARRARTRRASPARRLQQMQIAVGIELLLCAPVRLANLAALDLGKHLPRRIEAGGKVELSFRPEEMKNGRPMLLPVSESGVRLLAEYMRDFRSHGAAADNDALFVNGPLGRKSADSLRDGITKAIRRHVGLHMTPHQFRHLAGDLILRADPTAYPIVQQLLGHASLKTTTNFYLANQSRAAGLVLDSALAPRRGTSR